MRDLTSMLTSIPVIGLACVIDRPGYDARYREQYGRNQWQLCKTACSIAVERAAKQAARCACCASWRKEVQRTMRSAYALISSPFARNGSPFDRSRSGTLRPPRSKRVWRDSD